MVGSDVGIILPSIVGAKVRTCGAAVGSVPFEDSDSVPVDLPSKQTSLQSWAPLCGRPSVKQEVDESNSAQDSQNP